MSVPSSSSTVSIITPTKNREAFLPRIAACVQAQTVAWEWLVCDDSAAPSPFMRDLAARDARVTYLHSAQPLSIGAKRNRLIEVAQGDVIAHFDDDDYYGPLYLQRLLTVQKTHNADLVKLAGFFMVAPGSGFFGYMNLNVHTGLHHTLIGNQVGHLIFTEAEPLGADIMLMYGFSCLYRRAAWQGVHFEDIDRFEDERFVRALLAQGRSLVVVEDTAADCLHTVHPQSTASCLANHRLPLHLLPRLFPDPLAQQWPADLAAWPLSPYLTDPV